MTNNFGRQFQRAVFRGGIPATVTLIGLNLLIWLITIFTQSAIPLAFTSATWPLPAFWTFLTWPLYGGALHPISLLFACLWAWSIGGSLERSWGTRDYVGFLAANAALTAVTVWGGAHLMNSLPGGREHIGFLAGLWAAMAAPTVAWAVINRRETVYLYFFPVPAPAMAALAVAMLWWEVGAPFLGLFALSGCAAAYWYASQGRYGFSGYTANRSARNDGGRGSSRRDSGPSLRPDTAARFRNIDRERSAPQGGWNPLRWWKERRERKRLEAIFRRSGFTDKD